MSELSRLMANLEAVSTNGKFIKNGVLTVELFKKRALHIRQVLGDDYADEWISDFWGSVSYAYS